MRDTEIYFMDESFTVICIVEGYSSLQWNESYYGVGRFSLAVPGKYARAALKSKYVIWTGSPYTGIIENFKSDAGAATLAGHFLEKELLYRVANHHVSFHGNAEGVIRMIVDRYCISPAARRIPLLRLGANGRLGGRVAVSPFGQTVLEALEEACLEQEISFRMRYDFREHVITFEVFKGIDRTQGQDANPWCTFSRDFDNVLDERYVIDDEGRNFLYVAGEGEGAGRVILEMDLSGSRRRREMFIDARDLNRRLDRNEVDEDDPGCDGLLPMPEYIELLRTRGLQRAAEYATIETVDVSVAPQNTMEYGLGDVVTYSNHELGIVMEKRITEICHVIERGFAGCRVTLGKSALTIVDKIKRERGVKR